MAGNCSGIWGNAVAGEKFSEHRSLRSLVSSLCSISSYNKDAADPKSDSTFSQNSAPESLNTSSNRKCQLLRRRFGFRRGLGLDLFMKSLISLLLRGSPRTLLIYTPMLCHLGLADVRFRAAAIDQLIIAVTDFLISIFHPKAGLINVR